MDSLPSKNGRDFGHPRPTIGNPVSGSRTRRVYGVGAAKTGTHSLAAMFADRVRAAHEVDAAALIDLVLHRARTGDAGPLKAALLTRDRRRRLAVDVSHVNLYLIDLIEDLFPDSRYVATVRRPLAWLDSFLNESLGRWAPAVWHRFRDFRFGPARASAPEEAALAERGLYPLAGYLGHWRLAVSTVLTRVPSDRRMLIETTALSTDARRIAQFCGVPEPDRCTVPAHAYANPARFAILSRVPPAYLVATVEGACGDVARQVFPDWSAESELAEILART